MYITKVVGDLKHGAGMVATHQWELGKLGGEILELQVRGDSAEVRTGGPACHRRTASILWTVF